MVYHPTHVFTLLKKNKKKGRERGEEPEDNKKKQNLTYIIE